MPRRHLFGRYPTNDLYEFSCRNQRFENSFYPDSVNCWNKLSPETRQIETLKKFKENILKDIKPKRRSIFNLHDPDGVKFIYQLRVGLSPLREHKNRHNFLDTLRVESFAGRNFRGDKLSRTPMVKIMFRRYKLSRTWQILVKISYFDAIFSDI